MEGINFQVWSQLHHIPQFSSVQFSHSVVSDSLRPHDITYIDVYKVYPSDHRDTESMIADLFLTHKKELISKQIS